MTGVGARARGRAGAWLVALALGAGVFASSLGPSSRVWAGGDEETAEPPESVLQSSEARAALEAVSKKLDAERWDDAFEAASELLSKHDGKLIALEAAEGGKRHKAKKALGLHVEVGGALRRRLAALPAAGLKALAKKYDDKGKAALEKIDAHDTVALEAFADRWFPLPGGARALALAAEEYRRRGDLAGAWTAFREVLVLHKDGDSRAAAAKGLLALLPGTHDPLAARALVELVADAKLATSDDLARAAKEVLAKLEEPELPACSFDGSGGIAPLASARPPGELAQRIDLPDVPKQADWRHETDPQRAQFELPPCRRLLAGSAAAPGALLVHLGKAILAYDESGQLAWNVGGGKNLSSYFEALQASTSLPRYGIAVEGSAAYATLRAKPRQGDEPVYPEGRLVAIDLSAGNEGQLLWDSQKSDGEEKPKKKKAKKEEAKRDDEKAEKPPKKGDKKGEKKPEKKGDDDDKEPEARLSFAGRPLVHDGRVFCGAWNLDTPSEVWLVALEAATGKVLWKRALATTESYTAVERGNRWMSAMPRALPCPTLGLGLGAVLALSNNGCLAALDPATGRFLWAQAYERDEFKQEQPWRRTPAEDKVALGHAPNAPLAWGQSVLVVPSDSPRMLVYGVLDGAPLGKHGRGSYEHVLGAVRDTLIVQGDGEVAGYTLAAAEGSVGFDCAWSQSLGRAKAQGRGALVGKWVYVPTEKELTAFRASNGEKREVLTWDGPKREAGDLVVGGGRFYTVSARYAHAYREEP